MIHRSGKCRPTLRVLVRMAALACVLCAPLAAINSVKAASDTFIGHTPEHSSGAGLVLVMSLQRG